jgi:hypothetical protein
MTHISARVAQSTSSIDTASVQNPAAETAANRLGEPGELQSRHLGAVSGERPNQDRSCSLQAVFVLCRALTRLLQRARR